MVRPVENQENITVFEGTGRVGKELLKLLSDAKIPTIAVTENARKVDQMPFVEWINIDPSNGEDIAKIMKRTKSLFLAMRPRDRYAELQHKIIQAAADHRVKHIIKMSTPAADINSSFPLSKILGEGEEYLKSSGVAWTILQINALMQFWLGDFSLAVKKERKIYRATGNGKRAYVDARDVAEIAMKAIIEPEKHTSKTYVLTGEEAVNYAGIAEILSRILKKEVIFISLTPDQARKRMEEKGMPEAMIKTVLTIMGKQCNGETSFMNNNIAEILQKPARTIEEFLTDHLNWFR